MALNNEIVITGASGFIGRYLIGQLVSLGYSPILTTRKLRPGKQMPDTACRWFELDLTRIGSTRELLKELKPKVLIHLAGTRGRDDPRGAEVACKELNICATSDLLESATSAGVARVVIVGSAEEYGNQPGPLQESFPSQPASVYGNSKAIATSNALRMHKEASCPVVIVRPFTVYGPDQPNNMFISEAVDAAVRDVDFQMSEGHQKRDLVFVEDVVRGLIAAATVPNIEGQILNLGSGIARSLRDVAQRVWEIASARSALMIGARKAQPQELYDTWADITLAQKLLNWTPTVSLNTGLERTIEHVRRQMEERSHTCLAV